MIGDILQPTHLLFILVVALLVLGPKRLPEVGRSLGRGIRDFKGALTGDDDDHAVAVPSQTTPPGPQSAHAPDDGPGREPAAAPADGPGHQPAAAPAAGPGHEPVPAPAAGPRQEPVDGPGQEPAPAPAEHTG